MSIESHRLRSACELTIKRYTQPDNSSDGMEERRHGYHRNGVSDWRGPAADFASRRRKMSINVVLMLFGRHE